MEDWLEDLKDAPHTSFRLIARILPDLYARIEKLISAPDDSSDDDPDDDIRMATDPPKPAPVEIVWILNETRVCISFSSF